MTDAPLAGVTILDLSRVLAGPFCTMLAADMGARVIKIEHPERGDDTRAWGPPFQDGESAYFLSVNRNKESVAIDFKTADGRRILDELIARADVLVENFRPGTLAAQGLGFADLHARHPRLVYVSISGFGQTGPRHEEAGYDAIAQAEGGLMSVTGLPDGPAVRSGVAIADLTAGMFAFQGLLLALRSRDATGRGQLVDIGLLDSVLAYLTIQAQAYFATGAAPKRQGNRHTAIAPYETFDTADGMIVLAVGNDDQWQRFCRAMGLTALAGDARFTTNAQRVRELGTLRPMIATALASRPLQELLSTLRAAGVPCGAVRSVPEALSDPQAAARAMIETLDHPTIGPLKNVGLPIKLSATPGRARSAPPRLGEHTRGVLGNDLGMDEQEISALAARGIVR
ncbi:MAG TPA: CoA transferase [Vicinamibacterales bacterium]|nr:CoA transferase [Vicinamibacterales bacterium]